jgi:SpoVK/Ycf46/Vps4 family AAA+-type ATPase
MTTNYCCNLDSALKRPGRVDNLIHFDYTDKAQVELIFKKFYKKDNVDDIFKQFWKEIKYLKLTTAILQGFLFRYRHNDIFEHLTELKKTVEQNKYDAPTDLYS